MNNVIIVAGGKGLRMGGDLPKQFISIGGKPILMRTIENFYNYDKSIRIIVVLHESYCEYWSRLCKDYSFDIHHDIVTGGDNRFDSVKNGLSLVVDGLVAIQDGVRPFASRKLIENCFEQARLNKAVIPVINLTDSIRRVNKDGTSEIVDRNYFCLIQTPQVFDTDLLKKAYRQSYKDLFTDDASVVESIGNCVYLVEGEKNNIKITTPFDLNLAEVILRES